METVLPVVKSISLERLLVTGYRDFLSEVDLDEVPGEYLRERRHFPDHLELLDVLKSHALTSPETKIDLHRDIALIQYTGGTTGLPKGRCTLFTA